MTLPLRVLGLSHKTAPLELRERLALAESAQSALLRQLGQSPGEALLVSTCNRVEFYLAGEVAGLLDAVREQVVALAGAHVLPHLYLHEGETALVHLFRVTASLDSMVVGEPQILGQMKDAFELAQRAGAARGELARICAAAFGSAKRVRSETEIGRAATSMASAAVALASKIFGGLEGKAVLLIGAGEMIELAARHLRSAGAAPLRVANRTLDRAAALAAQVSGEAVPFETLDAQLVAADVIICSTASATPILTRERIAATLRPRRYRPLFIVDLAVPRDVAPDVGTLETVYAYDVDDIQRVIAENTAFRAASAERAEVIVAEEVARFCQARAARDGVPVLARLRARAEQIRRAELERALANLPAPLTDAQRAVVEAMTAAIVNKMLHQPTAKLRAVVPGEGVHPLADAAAELFGLEVGSAKSGSGDG